MENEIENETGAEADVDMNADGSMKVTTKEGTYTTGSNTMPEDWPEDAPVFADATVQFSGSTNPVDGGPGVAAVLMTDASVETVMAFYTDELTKKGWTIVSTMQAQGTNVIGATKDDRVLSLMVGDSGNGQTSITIGVGRE